MATKSINSEAKKAIMIGSLCSISYLAVYIARNILGAVSPQMIEEGTFATEQIGTLSSLYFITYAVGQLINGAIGDRIKARYMISLGLILAGIGNFIFPIFSEIPIVTYIAYSFTGFCLSMIYGPMTKVVAENTEPLYTTRCTLGYTFSSFFGSPAAGFLAALLTWQSTFFTSSLILIIMGVVSFIAFIILERRGFVKYNQFNFKKEQGGAIKQLFKRQIVKFTIISIITGVVRTSVVFWLTTYLTQYLGFSSDNSALIFTISTFVISATPFIAIFIYERLNRNMDLTILISFVASAVFFLSVYFFKQPTANIILLILAIMASNSAASMLFSRYCPSLWDTGMVSSATGFLDFVSYMAASISSKLFANAVLDIGWGNLILIWFALELIGIVISLPFSKIKRLLKS